MVKKLPLPPRAPRKRTKPITSVVILLLITIAASGGAFLWLNKVKIGELAPGCDDPSASFCIQEIEYDLATGNMIVWVFNKNKEDVSILKDASDKDKTRLTIFTDEGTLDNCVFKSLSDLKCDATAGLCEGTILPGSGAAIKLKGNREYCKISNSGGYPEYWLRMDFKEDTVRKQFIPL